MSIRKARIWIALLAAAAAIVFGWRWSTHQRGNHAKAAAPNFVELLSAWQERLDRDLPSADLQQETSGFPADHGAHPHVPAERWEVLTDLQAGDRRFAVRLQLDRLGARPETARSSRWAAHEFFHSTVSFSDFAEQRSVAFEHSARSALGMSGHGIDPPRVWLSGNGLEWRATAAAKTGFAVSIREPGLAADLQFEPMKPPAVLPQGVTGTGRWTGYGLSRNRVSGSLTVEGRVSPVSGIGWFSHAWGVLPPVGGQIAFDRWTLLLDNGTEFVLWQMRRRDGGGTPTRQGFRVAPDAHVDILDAEMIAVDPIGVRGGYPEEWRFTVPAQAVDLRLFRVMRTWVEIPGSGRRAAAIRVQGVSDGTPVSGWGLVELEGASSGSTVATKR